MEICYLNILTARTEELVDQDKKKNPRDANADRKLLAGLGAKEQRPRNGGRRRIYIDFREIILTLFMRFTAYRLCQNGYGNYLTIMYLDPYIFCRYDNTYSSNYYAMM